MKLHVLAVPHTVTTNKGYLSCAFTQKVVKFCQMMKPYYDIIHYVHERSEVDCYEHVTVMTDEVLQKTYGGTSWQHSFARHSIKDLAHKTFNKNTHKALASRIAPGDAILCFWGKSIAKAVKGYDKQCFVVEPGIGYGGWACFAPFKIFESYAHMSNVYGQLRIHQAKRYDAVIPNYFDCSDFEYNETKADYFLYLGRIDPHKGITTAIRATEKAGVKLIVAGPGDVTKLGYTTVPEHVEFIGYADIEKRKQLLRHAKALFLPSLVLEVFGGVMIEAMLSGTPVITSDWGGLPENNLHGITGFRCRNEEQFYWATKSIDKISPRQCRDWAEQNFSMERVAKMYDSYFKSLQRNFAPQETTEDYPRADHVEIEELNWLNKYFPAEKR
jgi:glycosyltransferase involved in cell wall biosynthesis